MAMRADRGEREAKALTKALAPYRSGQQGKLRAYVRCMLVQLMGFAECEDIPTGIRKIPHWFPRQSGLEPDEMRDMMMVAHDGLLELGYEAAAQELTYWTRGAARGEGGMLHIEIGAKNALENLESGPPSVMIDLYPIITKTICRYRKAPNLPHRPDREYLVGRNVKDPRWWYRFVRGRSVRNQRGELVGWDDEAGYTFQRRGRSIEDVLAAKYGDVALA